MAQSFQRIVDQVRQQPNAIVHEAKCIGSHSVWVSKVRWDRGEWAKPPAEYYSLVLFRTPARLVQECCGEVRPMRWFAPGDLVLRPPGVSSSTKFLDPVEVSVLAITEQLLEESKVAPVHKMIMAFKETSAKPFRSPTISSLAECLAEVPATKESAAYCDSLISALLHELWRIMEFPAAEFDLNHKPFTKAQLVTLDEFIFEADTNANLPGLAGCLGMSEPAFTATLRITTGMTPYQFVISRRLQRAQDLITSTSLTLQEIAWRTGFSSQSHMTDVFRAKLGTTPGKLRST